MLVVIKSKGTGYNPALAYECTTTTDQLSRHCGGVNVTFVTARVPNTFF